MEICRLCFDSNSTGFVPLNLQIGSLHRKQLGVVFPEIDLESVSVPYLCSRCSAALESAYVYKSTWLACEEKLKKYVERNPDLPSYSLSDVVNDSKAEPECSEIEVKLEVETCPSVPDPLDSTMEFVEVAVKQEAEEIDHGTESEMADYEKGHEWLRKLKEECLEGDREDLLEIEDSDGSLREETIDEQRSDSESEQEVDFLNVEDGPSSSNKRQRESIYAGKDGTIWRAHALTNKRIKLLPSEEMKRFPGPTSRTKNLKNTLDIWSYFINDEILSIILEYTNQYIETVGYRFGRNRDGKQTDIDEIRAFIGLLYISGTYKGTHSNLKDLWDSSERGVEIFRLTMSLRRFNFLLRSLRFDDRSTREHRKQFDKLAPIRQLFDLFVSNCNGGYNLSDFTTIDEKLEGFRGNCPFRQYVPSKPKRYGIKIFALCDARMYYTANLEVYVGTQPEGPYFLNNSPEAVVERLIQPIKHSGRNITLDNWFTSFPLIDNLDKNYGLTVIGTIRKNKTELPVQFLSGNRPIKSSLFAFKEKCTLVSYCPKKNKVILLASSMHDNEEIDPESGDSYEPVILTTYNQTKGAVDTVDKLCATYDCARISSRWPMVIFYSCLNIAGINSQVIYQANNMDTNLLRRNFLQNLGFSLLGTHIRKRATVSCLPKNIQLRLKELCSTLPKPPGSESKSFPKRGRCKFCDSKKNRPSRYYCKKCHIFMCLEHASFICHNCLE